MKNNTAIIISAIIGAIATISAAVIGRNIGEKNAVQQLYSQITTVNGNNNTITINSVDDFITQYNKLLSENETLKSQNSQYFADYTEQKNINNALESQLGEQPIVSYNDLGLCIDGDDISINKQKAMVLIDGREYYSKELAESFLNEDQNIIIKDETLFIGKVVADKANLLEQRIVDSYIYDNVDNITDSYGNTHINTLCFNPDCYNSRDAYVIFNLDEKFKYLDMSISISENTNANSHGILIIKADDNVVYTSDQLLLTTNPFSIKNIPINGCNLLTINYNYNGFNQCIISDAIVYN